MPFEWFPEHDFISCNLHLYPLLRFMTRLWTPPWFFDKLHNSKKFQASGLKMKCQSTKLLVGRAGDRKPQGTSESSLVL